ncbi:MAG: MiaB/RimO family radical SAM methylthiotransferase [Actinomycetota bacterium]|nr:MiaB/RimO family radical SAM methylthiotransferase [Actinomycetota bacterium]
MDGTYRITTLGCKVNKADSLAIEEGFCQRGYVPVPQGEPPEVWVVNTCAVTEEAFRKSKKEVKRAKKSGARIAVTGCAVEMKPEAFEEIGVFYAVKNIHKENIPGYFITRGERANHALVRERTRVPLKIQDGCERGCSYCVIPRLRQRVCLPMEKVLARARELAQGGAGEIVLCGIDVGRYEDPESGKGLEELLLGLAEEVPDTWIRLSSIELSEVSEGVISLLAERNPGNICPHLHIPLQSADNKVLFDMGRGYTREEFFEKLSRIKRRIPDVAVSTDAMVGFPTEGEKEFLHTLDFLKEAGFSRTHVFKYSPRPGTKAEAFGDVVSPREKSERARRAREVASSSACDFHHGFVGRIIMVLMESFCEEDGGVLRGRAMPYMQVSVRGWPELVGKKVPAVIEEANSNGLKGRLEDLTMGCNNFSGR